MTTNVDRRRFLTAVGGAAAATAASAATAAGLAAPVAVSAATMPAPPTADAFRYCLNTSTIRGQNLTLEDEVDIAARAGYQGIEPWIREIAAFRERGGALSDLRKRIADAGLVVESAIGFANWIVDDPAQRAAALETARQDMEWLREIGGTRIAAPPAGATNLEQLSLPAAAERYAELLRLGAEMGVTPQLEIWGFSKQLSKLGEVLYVAAETGRGDACLLLDVYHLYKGGNDFAGLKLVSGAAMHALHMNDYPADPPRAQINDAARVYPGDGIAPLTQILGTLVANGFRGVLSLELFNPEYWKQDALAVARTGLEKMRAAVAKALEA